MKRRLVLTNEAARHPFRRTLPPAVSQRRRRQDDDQDIRLFVLSFTAFFICIYTFLF
ncbi:hypothetical protein KV697_01985 [Sphingomonas sanguinis]|uniref:Transmembrane protein n=1 Tax=Sphingomonas sanguinis TaxID=33051 RepID=A0ABU5LKP3_9SPHN|nr:hypothetical protein [Sphingomonas sanguinis]MDZ7280504.1 hypothetical protein [Sphingomonas sanguinis]QXT36164.1 hypothetical protein KV697_01985 [Sphingomonas sanguinis]